MLDDMGVERLSASRVPYPHRFCITTRDNQRAPVGGTDSELFVRPTILSPGRDCFTLCQLPYPHRSHAVARHYNRPSSNLAQSHCQDPGFAVKPIRAVVMDICGINEPSVSQIPCPHRLIVTARDNSRLPTNLPHRDRRNYACRVEAIDWPTICQAPDPNCSVLATRDYHWASIEISYCDCPDISVVTEEGAAERFAVSQVTRPDAPVPPAGNQYLPSIKIPGSKRKDSSFVLREQIVEEVAIRQMPHCYHSVAAARCNDRPAIDLRKSNGQHPPVMTR